MDATTEAIRRKERVMNKAETIAYAIKKECQRYSLVDWCEEWGFSVDEFNRFLTLGQEAFYQEQTERD